MSEPKPLDIVMEYYDWVWTGKDVQRIRALCANPVLRHDPGGDVVLSHADQIARIEAALSKRLQYKFIVSYSNDEFTTMVWQAVSAVNRGVSLAGIQVLRVTGGRIAEVWNATKPELWVAQDVDGGRAIAAAGTTQMRRRAAALGEKMRAEDGLAAAVGAIQSLTTARDSSASAG